MNLLEAWQTLFYFADCITYSAENNFKNFGITSITFQIHISTLSNNDITDLF